MGVWRVRWQGRGAKLARVWPASDENAASVRVRRSARRFHHLAELLLEVTDLVAEAGGDLELQVGGSLLHLVGEGLDELGEVGGRDAGRVGRLGVDPGQGGRRR